MRGFFGIGAEGISKPMNLGNLLRSSHAFGASFFFTVGPAFDVHEMRASDTSGAFGHLPLYNFGKPADLILPHKTALVAVELLPDAIELPSFRHPQQAVYVLGPEGGNVSDEMLERCDFKLKIPLKFCINVGVAGALVMYDRMISTGRFADRPVHAGSANFAPQQLKADQVICE